ncbi:MAG: hypothetical protein KDK37_04490 [Leptospiraceae bacterium]|nr:hypothetical protein [Leptospiraceae bacterium]MCB1303506.1 hypothetical protein [Leptospiraceae bacterium]
MKRKAKDKIGVLLLRILIFVALPLLDCAGAGTLVRESPIPIEELQPNTLLICADNKLRTTDSDLECAATTKHWASRAGIRIFLISEVKIPDLPLADVGAPENRRVIFGRGIEYVLIISPNRMGWVVYSPNGDTEYGIGLRTEWVRRWPLETCQIVVDAQKTDLDSGGIALDLSNRGIHEFSNLELLDVRGTGLKPKNLESPRSVHVDY